MGAADGGAPPLKIELSGVPATLLITLWAKALDARAADPALHDRFADAVVRRIDHDFDAMRLTRDNSLGIALRAKALDGWVRAFLAAHPRATVLNLAAGLDSRVFRIDPPPGVAWIDLDLPEVVSLRRRLYPERPGTRLVGASVTEAGWLDEVPDDRPAIVVAEGLSPYLREDDAAILLERVTRRVPAGELVLDVYNGFGLWLIGRYPALRATGVSLHWAVDDPRRLCELAPRLAYVETFRDYEPADIAKFSPGARLMLLLWSALPVLRNAGRVLRYRF